MYLWGPTSELFVYSSSIECPYHLTDWEYLRGSYGLWAAIASRIMLRRDEFGIPPDTPTHDEIESNIARKPQAFRCLATWLLPKLLRHEILQHMSWPEIMESVFEIKMSPEFDGWRREGWLCRDCLHRFLKMNLKCVKEEMGFRSIVLEKDEL